MEHTWGRTLCQKCISRRWPTVMTASALRGYAWVILLLILVIQGVYNNKPIIRIHISATSRVKCTIIIDYGFTYVLKDYLHSFCFCLWTSTRFRKKKKKKRFKRPWHVMLDDVHPNRLQNLEWVEARFLWHGTCISPTAETPPFLAGAECHCGNWRRENVALWLVKRVSSESGNLVECVYLLYIIIFGIWWYLFEYVYTIHH